MTGSPFWSIKPASKSVLIVSCILSNSLACADIEATWAFSIAICSEDTCLSLTSDCSTIEDLGLIRAESSTFSFAGRRESVPLPCLAKISKLRKKSTWCLTWDSVWLSKHLGKILAGWDDAAGFSYHVLLPGNQALNDIIIELIKLGSVQPLSKYLKKLLTLTMKPLSWEWAVSPTTGRYLRQSCFSANCSRSLMARPL